MLQYRDSSGRIREGEPRSVVGLGMMVNSYGTDAQGMRTTRTELVYPSQAVNPVAYQEAWNRCGGGSLVDEDGDAI
jgi:hypothetical protein